MVNACVMTSTPTSPPSSAERPGASPPPPTPSTTMATSPSSSQAPVGKVTAGPVTILPSQASQIYAIAHPALLLTLYAARFDSLVADPVGELVQDIPILVALQMTYAILCLPPAGTAPPALSSSSTSSTPVSTTVSNVGGNKAALKRKHGHGHVHGHGPHGGKSIWTKITPAVLSITLTFTLATPILTILLVLFGAPLTTHNAHTLFCAAHMALLTAAPLIYVHGVDGAVWHEVWGLARPADAVWGGTLGTCIGAWFGAVPIPLDWDRPWQAFPITIITGAYIGYALGSWLCRLSFLYGKRVEFTAAENRKGPEETSRAKSD